MLIIIILIIIELVKVIVLLTNALFTAITTHCEHVVQIEFVKLPGSAGGSHVFVLSLSLSLSLSFKAEKPRTQVCATVDFSFMCPSHNEHQTAATEKHTISFNAANCAAINKRPQTHCVSMHTFHLCQVAPLCDLATDGHYAGALWVIALCTSARSSNSSHSSYGSSSGSRENSDEISACLGARQRTTADSARVQSVLCGPSCRTFMRLH